MSEYLANRKGLLPLVGIILVILNFVFQFFPGWLAETDLFLHTGVILAVLGIMLGWAL
jgi:hypothetical protein